MGLAATPVDAELAAPRIGSLIQSVGTITDGNDYESPAVLGYALEPVDLDHDQNPTGDPNRPQGPGIDDMNTANPERLSRVRWIDGFQFLPEDCTGGHIVDPCQLGAGADTADARSVPGDVVGPIQPYIIEASDTASTWHPEPYRLARAQRKLLAVQSRVMEAEFWSGTKAASQGWTNNQYLTNPTGLTVLPVPGAGSAFGLVDGLAALEQAIVDGSAWERGVIHADPRLVSHWTYANMVSARGGPPGTLMTQLGTIVVAGAGYPGTGPGAPPESVNPIHLSWAFVTPPPQIRLGQITLNQTDEDSYTVDRQANDRTIRVSRFAACTFSPCFRAAALVNMASEHAVPGS